MLNSVSIIIPVYNAAKYLPRCIDSLVHQEQTNFIKEVIFVDDGSTDDSANVIKSMCIRLPPPVIYLTQKNKGPSAARNLGMSQASGDLIYFLDADDEVLQYGLGKLHNAMSEYSADMVFANACYIDMLGNIKCQYKHGDQFWQNKAQILDFIRYYANDPKAFRVLKSGWNKLYKTSLLRKYNIRWNENMLTDEDSCFVLEYIGRCESIYYIGDELYRYYRLNHTAQQSRKVSLEPLSFLNVITAVERILTSQKADKILLGNCLVEWAIWRMFQICFFTDWDNESDIKIAYECIKQISSHEKVIKNLKHYSQKHNDNPSIIPWLIHTGNVEDLLRVFREHILNLRRSNY